MAGTKRVAITWTPILRDNDGDSCGPAGTTAAYAAGAGVAAFRTLPREQALADKHPLAVPRVKQRPRRTSTTTSTTTTAAAVANKAATVRRRASAATRSSSAPAAAVAVVGDGNFGAVFGDSNAGNNGGADSSGAGSKNKDPLLELWMTPPPPPAPESVPAGEGEGGVAGSDAADAPETQLAAFNDVERDVKVAVAGLSDDPLSMMMQERAVARNMSRHGGSVLDDNMLDDAIMTPGSPGSADTASVVLGNGGGGGSSSLLEDLERGSSRLSEAGGAAAAGGAARGGVPSDGAAGKEGEGGWGKAWEAHRRSMLREFGVEGGDKSQAGGQTARAAPLPTSFAARLEELEGPATGGGESGAGGGSGGSGGGKSGGDGGRGKKKNASTSKGTAGGLLLTPEEYVAHVSALKEDLEVAWAREEKVAALKVTVQAAKLLGDVTVPSFYPALFASVAGLLEAFGVMVFERIRHRAEDVGEEASPTQQGNKGEPPADPSPGAGAGAARHALPRGWTCDDVSAEARETCRNWFYKTACIRELLPRILIEAALLPCYRFLANEDEFGQILGRLSTLVRGVGNPMVAVYCRCFVAAAGAEVAPRESAHAVASLQDYLFSLQEVQQGKLEGYLRANRFGLPEYLHLHAPAIDWLLGVVGPGAPRGVFTSILAHYRNHCGVLEVLRLILDHFGPEHYAPFALEMALLIKQGQELSTRCTVSEVMGLLGLKLSGAGSAHPSGPEAVPLLNEAWQEIAPAPLEVYVEGAAAWLGVLLQSPAYGPDEVAILMEDVACRVEDASATELASVQERLADGVVSALACAKDPSALRAAGGHVVKVLGVLDKNRRAQACLDLLAAFIRALPRHTPPATGRGSARPATNPLPPPPPPPVTASPESSAPGEREDGRSKSGSGDGGRGEKGAVIKGEVELARALVGVAKLLHDSFDLLSSGERQRQSAVALTCDMVDRVGRGWAQPLQPEEGQNGGEKGADGGTGEASRLEVLAECRQAFWGMDEVTDRLVLAAAGLSLRAWRAGSTATARAALCFCSLTVPSVPSALRRLALLQLCANTALQIGKPALADALFRSAICVVPECSPLVVSGADPTGSSRGSGSLRGSGGLHRSPGNPDAADRKSYGLSGRFGGSAAAGGGRGGGGDGAWGPLPPGPGGRLVLGMGGRREHLGAWLLCDAVKSLLGALVAAPGHPDLGPFYLLRGLLKAVRRLPWPAGSGLLASLYITAAGTLCAMWQERLPYSVGAAAGAAARGVSSQGDGPDHVDDHQGKVEGEPVAAAADSTTTAAAAAATASATTAAAAAAAVAAAAGVEGGKAGAGGGTGVVAAVGSPSPPPLLEGSSANEGADVDGTGTAGNTGDDGSGSSGGSPAEDEGGQGGEEDGDAAEAEAAAAGTVHEAGVGGAGPEEKKKSWLDVGGVLGNDDLYLRNSAYLEEVRGLLGDVVMATLRELEELCEQGEAEMASIIGDDHTRTARLRYICLALDLANQLVSNVKMEGGAASVVTYLIEAAARAGARDSGVGVAGGGNRGGSRGSGGILRKGAGTGDGGGGGAAVYFDSTVAFVSGVANRRLSMLADLKSDSVEAEEQEEACLSLLQGLSGFGAPSGYS